MALFKTIPELAKYIPVRLTLDMDDIAQTMERVENDYLVNMLIGPQQYTELHNIYQADAVTPGSLPEQLLHHCRGVVAHLIAYHYADLGAVQWTSSGPVVASGQDGQSVAGERKIERWKRELMKAGFSFMDKLLAFLQDRAIYFPLWSDTVLATRAQGLLRSTMQFQSACDIGLSHFFYWRLRPVIERHQNEDGLIARTLCNPLLYAELVEQSNRSDDFTPANLRLIRIIRPAIAHLSLAEALADCSVEKDDRGVWSLTSFTSSSAGPVPIADSRLDMLIKYHERRASEWVDALRNKLQEIAAAGDLPLYASSSCYQAPSVDTTPEPKDPTRLVAGFI